IMTPLVKCPLGPIKNHLFDRSSMSKKFIIAVSCAFALLPVLASAQTAPLAAPTAACTDVTMNLHMGTAKDAQEQLQVSNLQIDLVHEGFTIDSTELGMFGASTKAAVRAFQEKY